MQPSRTKDSSNRPVLPAAGGASRGPSAAHATRREVEELVRLARTILAKSPADLAAIADDNAAVQASWIESFAEHRARAEAEAQFWSAAIAYLMASAPRSVANDG